MNITIGQEKGVLWYSSPILMGFSCQSSEQDIDSDLVQESNSSFPYHKLELIHPGKLLLKSLHEECMFLGFSVGSREWVQRMEEAAMQLNTFKKKTCDLKT